MTHLPENELRVYTVLRQKGLMLSETQSGGSPLEGIINGLQDRISRVTACAPGVEHVLLETVSQIRNAVAGDAAAFASLEGLNLSQEVPVEFETNSLDEAVDLITRFTGMEKEEVLILLEAGKGDLASGYYSYIREKKLKCTIKMSALRGEVNFRSNLDDHHYFNAVLGLTGGRRKPIYEARKEMTFHSSKVDITTLEEMKKRHNGVDLDVDQEELIAELRKLLDIDDKLALLLFKSAPIKKLDGQSSYPYIVRINDGSEKIWIGFAHDHPVHTKLTLEKVAEVELPYPNLDQEKPSDLTEGESRLYDILRSSFNTGTGEAFISKSAAKELGYPSIAGFVKALQRLNEKLSNHFGRTLIIPTGKRERGPGTKYRFLREKESIYEASSGNH